MRHLIVILVISVCSLVSSNNTNDWHWPVFFERLGQVHSIHNKWDLALRVNVALPSLEAKVTKTLHKLSLLDGDFEVKVITLIYVHH